MVKHLSIRVAWHDNKWNGTVCCKPNSNSYCAQLPRIYEEKTDNEPARASWWDLAPKDLPPCKAEGGAFMNPKKYIRSFNHPYQDYKKADHGHLMRTEFEIPLYSTLAVPFWWMLNKNQKTIDKEYPDLPFNKWPSFPTPWVYEEKRQHALLNLFFEPIQKNKSLIAFYTKTGNPVDEECRRLLVGIGTVTDKSSILHYNTKATGPDYPLWDRIISHSIRPNGDKGSDKGFLIPYHEYLALDDSKTYVVNGKKKTKDELLSEIKVSLIETGDDESRIDDFSYGSQQVSNRNMLSILMKLRHVVETIMQHGIVAGPWKERLQWLSSRVGMIKDNMGPFPSFSSALVALGFSKGHIFNQDIYDLQLCETKGNPWLIFEKALNKKVKELNKKSYAGEFNHIKELWNALSIADKELLILLSRFELSATQIKRWFDSDLRPKNDSKATAEELLSNPYIIVGDDDPETGEYRIAVETIDAGTIEDKAVQGECVPKDPYRVNSKLDKRRIRALIITLLKAAADEGDTLLSIFEIRQRLNALAINEDSEIPANYIETHLEYFKEKLVHILTESVNALQLKFYDKIETELSKKLIARAKKTLPSLEENWEELIIETVEKNGGKIDKNNPRHLSALHDQTTALEKLTTRKLSILHGPAGTGKTSVMGALVRSQKLKKDGILLLAPTGKARVKLGKIADKEAFTVAQFLTRQGRFDWKKMKVKITGKEEYRQEKTVIIDECSMLTEEDLFAVFKALDLVHVKRIILVGDPFQLPPIGPGRPFADLCAHLDGPFCDNDDEELKIASKALAKLEVVVRTTNGGDSDTLTLASWFAGRKAGKNNDIIFEKIGDNSQLNDLRIERWKNPEELNDLIHKVLRDELKLNEGSLVKDFNRALGVDVENDEFPIHNPNVVENFQLLTPVKAPVWGTYNINRFIQLEYRDRPSNPWERPLGDQQIWTGDKVIQLKNEKRDGYLSSDEPKNEVQLSNGQIGYVVSYYKGYCNTAFAGLEGYTVGYNSGDFSEDGGKIELAYAITIHKSQGSDFNLVFLIMPKKGRILSRELLYTGLTRAKDKLILLVEGDDITWLFNYSKGEASETAKRNTHLFKTEIRESQSSIPFVQNLIHKDKDGNYVRSKSEVIIANLLLDAKIPFQYERRMETPKGWRLPDFTIKSADDDLIILEHLGMLHKPSYKDEWEKKKLFYEENGFVMGENLFVTTEDENGAIDSEKICNEVISKLKALI